MVQANRYSNEFDTDSDEAEVDEDSEDVDEDKESGESQDDNSDEGEDEEEGDEEEESGEDEDEDGEETGDEDGEETGDEDDEETGDDDDEEEESDEEEDEAHNEEDEFADEPGGAAEPSNIEADETDDVPTDEPEGQDSSKSTEEEDKRKKVLLFLACICCCLVVIIAVVLGVVLGGKDDDDESKGVAPINPIPSTSPAPSFVPTLHPDQIFFPVVADTYLRSGAFADQSFGTSEDLEVRNGSGDSNVAYMLLQFDLSGLPPGDSGNIFRPREVILRLSHVESVATGSANITVVKLPSDSNLDIESLTYQDFTPSDGEDGPTFVVAPDDVEVEVDITTMIEASNSQLRGRRHLQQDKIIFMLESRDSNINLSGEFFRSREYQNGDFKPMIIHNFVTTPPTIAPTVSPAPTLSSKPSMSPTISSAPTTSTAPSTGGSLPPTGASAKPSSSSKPSVSVSPSLQPSTSSQPSLSSKPSVNPTDSAKPSNGASSFTPTSTPSVSSKPSVSRQPSSNPTLSNAPSISSQPSTCEEQITPPLVTVRGPTTPFPEGALEYVSQDGAEVTMRIIQKWSDDDVAWIAPYYGDSAEDLESRSCERRRNVAPLGTIEVTFRCAFDRVTFAVIVNDGTFAVGDDLGLPPGCTAEAEDLEGQKVLYAFELKCSPPPASCFE